MEPISGSKWLLVAVLPLAVAFVLAGCAPRAYVPPPLPTAPAPAPPQLQVSRPVFYIKVNRLNLRACPGMDCPKISVLERGEEVEKMGAAEEWFQVRVKRDGRLGWVDSRYLSPTPVTGPEAAPPAAPVEVTPPPLPEKVQPTPLPEKAAPPPVEKAKPPAAEKAAPPPKKKPEEVKPAKPTPEVTPAQGKPAKTEAKPSPKEEKPAPKEEKPAPPAQGAPQPSNPIRIM